ncbi:sensor histidine kinase [Roseivirga sp. BDSF3-8]|uniref:sensor histidine kinase n=1 Tax=Roseivirga sp. BDSF3-8 TaxID=3241598 RepID=UPI003532608C
MHWKKATRTVLIILVVNLVVFLFICPPCMTTAEGLAKIWDDVLYSLLLSIGLWLGNGYISDYLDKRISWIETPLKRLLIGLVAMFGYSTFITLVISFVFLSLRHPEFTATAGWEFFVKVLNVPLIITLGITAFLTSRGFLLSWKQSAIDAEQARAEAIKFRYDALKSQLNPHFLFNSMNALTNLIYEDQEASVRFVRQLSQVYRYVLDTRDQEVVSLQEELGFLDAYIFLQKIRVEKALEIKLEPALWQVNGVVPPMSLQLLVENAIKHNIASQQQPLHICVKLENEYIAVTNQFRPKTPEDNSSGLGLETLRKRYENLTKKPVIIDQTKEHYTVKVPVLTLE